MRDARCALGRVSSNEAGLRIGCCTLGENMMSQATGMHSDITIQCVWKRGKFGTTQHIALCRDSTLTRFC